MIDTRYRIVVCNTRKLVSIPNCEVSTNWNHNKKHRHYPDNIGNAYLQDVVVENSKVRKSHRRDIFARTPIGLGKYGEKHKEKVFKETRAHSSFLEWWFPALLSVKTMFPCHSHGLSSLCMSGMRTCLSNLAGECGWSQIQRNVMTWDSLNVLLSAFLLNELQYFSSE